jgi:hypothetical protein
VIEAKARSALHSAASSGSVSPLTGRFFVHAPSK